MKKAVLLFIFLLSFLALACEDDANVQSKFCGNNVIEDTELCDGDDIGTLSCADFDESKDWEAGGTPACAKHCYALTQGTCKEKYVPSCGNGIVDEGEECDSCCAKPCTDIDSDIYTSGVAFCNTNECKWDRSQCVEKITTKHVYCQLASDEREVLFLKDPVTIAVKVHVHGITDKTVAYDPSEELMVEVYLESRETNYTETHPAIPDDQYIHPTDDLYEYTVQDGYYKGSLGYNLIYSFRVSIDEGKTWNYCKFNIALHESDHYYIAITDRLKDGDFLDIDAEKSERIDYMGRITLTIN
ncbi:MAG: hypothetical protein ACOX8U_11615 [Bradymonadia bacterium]|jgi:hypothetical protein